MEPNTQNATYTHKASKLHAAAPEQVISDLRARIFPWSSKGFQHFLESGALHDLVHFAQKPEAVILDFMLTLPPCEIQKIMQDRDFGSVTDAQINKLLAVIPSTNIAYWNRFLVLLGKVSQSAGWWENNKPGWDTRDKWRIRMNLERLNPIFKSRGTSSVDIIARRVCKEQVWQSSPEGYRFAMRKEAGDAVPGINDSFELVVREGKNWYGGGGAYILPHYCIKHYFMFGTTKFVVGDKPVYVALVKV